MCSVPDTKYANFQQIITMESSNLIGKTFEPVYYDTIIVCMELSDTHRLLKAARPGKISPTK